jgi:DNA-binding CsgD family transcriptional regulator
VADASRRATGPIELERQVNALLQRRVPSDMWCALTLDPATGDQTGGYHEEGFPLDRMARLLELEHDGDVATMRDLAASGARAVTLQEVTHGRPSSSARYRDVLEPSGVRHELRALFRGEAGAWGALVLMREQKAFEADELALVGSVSETVAEGLRRATLLGKVPPESDESPGLVIFSVDDVVSVDHCTARARQWLNEIDDGVEGGMPYAVLSLVHATRSAVAPQRRVRLRTRAGRWLTLHATRLGPSTVSVILEPARPKEIAELLIDAVRLTPREREVTGLAVRGLTNAQIGAALFLSPYTVNDHLKSVFTKTGVAGRTELAAKLYFDHA